MNVLERGLPLAGFELEQEDRGFFRLQCLHPKLRRLLHVNGQRGERGLAYLELACIPALRRHPFKREWVAALLREWLLDGEPELAERLELERAEQAGERLKLIRREESWVLVRRDQLLCRTCGFPLVQRVCPACGKSAPRFLGRF